jgi:hypothetical protein
MVNYSVIARSPFVMSAPNPRFQIAALKFGDSLLEVTWQDNHCSRYPGIWLLEACHCELCGDTETAVRHTRLTQKPHRPEIEDCRYDASSLDIDWGGAHCSHYDLAWLRTMCLSPQARRERKFKPSLWGSEMGDRLRWRRNLGAPARSSARAGRLCARPGRGILRCATRTAKPELCRRWPDSIQTPCRRDAGV